MLPVELEILVVSRYAVEERETLSYLVLREVCNAWNHTICHRMKDNFVMVQLLQTLNMSQLVPQEDYHALRSLFQNEILLISDEQLEHVYPQNTSLILHVCAVGDLQFAQYLHVHFPQSMKIPTFFQQSLLLIDGLLSGNLELCDWLVFQYEMAGNEIIFGTCAMNVLPVFALKWLDEQCPFPTNRRFNVIEGVFENACWNDDVSVVEWLAQRYPDLLTIHLLEQNRCWRLRMLAARHCLAVWNFLKLYFQLGRVEEYINTQMQATGDIQLTKLNQ